MSSKKRAVPELWGGPGEGPSLRNHKTRIPAKRRAGRIYASPTKEKSPPARRRHPRPSFRRRPESRVLIAFFQNGRFANRPYGTVAVPARRGRILAPRSAGLGDDAARGDCGNRRDNPGVPSIRQGTTSRRQRGFPLRPAPPQNPVIPAKAGIQGLVCDRPRRDDSSAPSESIAHLPAFAPIGPSPERARIRREREEANAWVSGSG